MPENDDDSSPAMTDGDDDSLPSLSLSDSDDDVGGASLVQVLRYLLQGQGRRVTDGTTNGSGSRVLYQGGRRRTRLHDGVTVPQPPDNPDTSIMDSSDLKQQMEYEADPHNGRKHPPSARPLPALLCMKEIGLLSRHGSMTHGQRVQASKHFLPTSYRPTKMLSSHSKFFCGVYNKEGDLFMSACQDSTLRIFDTSNGHWTRVKKINCKDVGWSVLDVCFSHSGNHVIYSSWSEYVHICNIRGDTDTHTALYLDPGNQYRTGVFSVSFSPDDSEIVAGTNNGYIYIYDRETGRSTMKLDGHDDDLSCVTFADDSGHILYSGGEDGVVKVWDRRCLCEETPQPVGQLAGHYDSITYIDSKNDARYLITNSKDQSIKLWDIRKFASSAGISATRATVSKQFWDYRWHQYEGEIVKRKLTGDCSLMTYYGHSVVRTLIRSRFSPAFTTGQRYIYSGDGMGRVIIYDLLTGKIVRILQSQKCEATNQWFGHGLDVVRDVSWHPYDNDLVSSGWDCMVYKWECNAEDY